MNQVEYEDFYNLVGRANGWDFSKLKVISEGVNWDFYEEVINRCGDKDIFLDIGTGGGENVLKVASFFLFLVGIDLSSGMIQKAQSNLRESNTSNVRFFQMPSEDLKFPRGFFDAVSSCHAPFSAQQVASVLRSGGWFLTEQVSEGDKLNLKKAFGRGQAFNERDGILKERYVHELIAAGFSSVQSFDYDAREYYQTPEDLVLLLKHTPIIPNFGQDKRDFEILNNFIEQNRTEKGIRTNSKRFLITAKR